MERFDIAGLCVEMNCQGGMIYERSRAYLSDTDKQPDMVIDIPEMVINEQHKRLSNLSVDECRYVLMGELFYYKLLDFNGILIHSSCIEKDGFAYLFSANSGIGKSTHTHIWMDVFDNVSMINDDKPAIRKINGRFMACGTPFSGKNDESSNSQVPLRAIVFVERSDKNSVEPLSAGNSIALLMAQTIRPSKVDKMDRMLGTIDKVLTEVPVFRLKCNMDNEAAIVAYEGIEQYIRKSEE